MVGARRRRAGLIIRAFSLVELVVVLMIIGMLASMAIPRLSQGATRANGAAAAGSLNTMRKAILYYAIEHRGKFPGSTAALAAAQLTQYSDLAGSTSPTRSAIVQFGPYLNAIPACPIGYGKDSNGILIDSTNSPPNASSSSSAGWVYNPNTGELYPNASETELTKILSVESATKLATEAVEGG